MMTARQIEKLWTARLHVKLLTEVLSSRPEASVRLHTELASPASVAAVSLIRLDELAQSTAPIVSTFVRVIVAAQEADGGWGSAVSTSVCLRALMCGNGHGLAIERGLQYLANLQKPEGIWPLIPIRRAEADPFVSAFVLLQLGDQRAFQQAVRFEAALEWFSNNELKLDAETRRLWRHASLRCLVHRNPGAMPVAWS